VPVKRRQKPATKIPPRQKKAPNQAHNTEEGQCLTPLPIFQGKKVRYLKNVSYFCTQIE